MIPHRQLHREAPIAAFDVDGTLTWTDSFVLFLRHVAGTPGFGIKMASVTPRLIAYKAGLTDRDAAKTAIVAAFLGGMETGAYLAACEAYAQATYPKILRRDGLEAVARHRQAGHRVVLVSASLTDYLVHLAAMIGADDVVATQVSMVGSTLPGALVGSNCWGPHKAARLKAAFPDAPVIAAYGDSRGDRELLQLARDQGGQGHHCLFKDQPSDRGAASRRLWFPASA